MILYFNYHNLHFVGEDKKEDDFIGYTEEQVEEFFKSGKDIQSKDKCVILVDKPPISLNELRNKRTILLLAFDKWEKAVLRNREQVSVVIMAWYQDLLDLVPSAFENIPERIKYYL